MLLQLSQETTQAGEPGAHRALGRLVVRQDLSQRQEVKSQLEVVGHEIHGPKADMAPSGLSAPQDPGAGTTALPTLPGPGRMGWLG